MTTLDPAARARLEHAITGRYLLQHQDIRAALAALDAATQALDDLRTGTHEMLGELLAAHHIVPEPCPGGPCVANALSAIGNTLTAATQERDDLAQRLSRVLTHDGSAHGCCWDALTTAVQTVVPGVEGAVAERDDAERAIAEHWRPLVAGLEAERDAALRQRRREENQG